MAPLPAPKKIDTSADPVCGQKNPNLSTEDTVVTNGKLANVFVYIKDGTTTAGKKIGDFAWEAPARPQPCWTRMVVTTGRTCSA